VDLKEINQLIRSDMDQVNALIRRQFHSDVVLIEQMAEYIINSGGKRLRPALAILAARACGYEGGDHVQIAAIIEFIHTATLLHDDVVDASDLRRGKETANSVWGNEASVLVGDFLFSRSFQMMVEVGKIRVMDVLATTSNRIAEGEVMQLLNCNDPDVDEQRYMDVIRCKTAQLFEAATRLGAILTSQSEAVERDCAAYGMHLGMAFQVIDDLLDYQACEDETGKHLGDDLAEGKPTLPLIYALRNGSTKQAELLRAVIRDGNRDSLNQVLEVIHDTRALEYTEQVAIEQINQAKSHLNSLPDSPFKKALISIADQAVHRRY
jgi:octaprenyl-diphosphate synthase